MNEAQSFGPWLKRLRVERDLTQDALAEQVGCAVQTIRMLEGGTRRPSRDLAERLADILAVPAPQRADFLQLARQREAPAAASVVEPTTLPEPPPTASPTRCVVLPVAPNLLIGRQHEHHKVTQLLAEAKQRLVTLVGPGGVGKTRLALQLAADLEGCFADGVVWVVLAPVAAPEHVVATVADALDLQLQGAEPPTEQLLHALRGLRLLLVFDNFEHVLPASELLGRILDEAPGVQLLVTSRERLRLQAEWVIELGGLQLPVTDSGEGVERAEAVLLFLDRARRTSGEFVLEAGNQAVVVGICRRLDGLPLALELAAARVKLMPPAALLQRLDRALPLLGGGARDLPERQRTMRATLQWSYDLLAADEQALFRRLAIFAGGWTLEAAEAVGIGQEVAADAVLELLANLVDKSLVVAEGSHDSAPRYRMLEPIRQYARELLDESGEGELVGRRHAALFLQLAEQARPHLRAVQGLEWLRRLDEEQDNLRTAMTWMLGASEWQSAARLGWALRDWWWFRARFHEGLPAMENVLASEEELSPLARIHVTIVAQAMTYGLADHDSTLRYAKKLLEICQQMGGNPLGEALAYLGIGVTALAHGDYNAATRDMERSLPLLIEVGEQGVAAQTQSFLGIVRLLQGDFEGATRRFEESLTLARRINDRLSTTIPLFSLAQLALTREDYEGAMRNFKEGISLAAQNRDWANVAYYLEGLAVAMWAQEQQGECARRAARLWGAAEGLIERVGVRSHPYYQPDRALYERSLADLRLKLGPSDFAKAWAEGKAMTFEQILAESMGSAEPTP